MKTLRKGMIATGRQTSYLYARRLVRGRGRLLSTVMHNELMTSTSDWHELKGKYPAWADELVAYPESCGKFTKGKDIVDQGRFVGIDRELFGRPRDHILPASYVPKEATGRKGVALLITPERFEEDTKRIVVIPTSVLVLHSFPQVDDAPARADAKTGIPVAVGSDTYEGLPEEEKRRLYRHGETGIKAVIFGEEYLDCGEIREIGRRDVLATADIDFGAAYVNYVSSQQEPEEEVARVPPGPVEATDAVCEEPGPSKGILDMLGSLFR